MDFVSNRSTTLLFDIGKYVREGFDVDAEKYLEKMQILVDLGSNLINHRGSDFRTLLSQDWRANEGSSWFKEK
jgi:hypothetical protein